MEPNPPPLPPMPPSAPPPYPPQQYVPQYAPPPPPNRSPVVWIVAGCLIVPLVLFAVLAAILFPVFAQAREKARQTSCLSNIKMLGLASMQYSQDWDEIYPAAKEWVGKLEPYTSGKMDGSDSDSEGSRFRRSVWQCPSVAKGGSASEVFGYAYNAKAGGREMASFSSAEIRETPLIYDSENLEKNASDPFQSVAYRHLHAACIGYADGHAGVQKSKLPGSE